MLVMLFVCAYDVCLVYGIRLWLRVVGCGRWFGLLICFAVVGLGCMWDSVNGVG